MILNLQCKYVGIGHRHNDKIAEDDSNFKFG